MPYTSAPNSAPRWAAEVCELLQAYPRMPATVIAERIGWDRGLTVLFAVGQANPAQHQVSGVWARFRGPLAGGAGRG